MFRIFFVLTLLFLSQDILSQKKGEVYVIVHGAWGGGWSFKKIEEILKENKSIVYRPTLTGQGERVHLFSKNIGLETHIEDVSNMIKYEDINNIILIGHSYGGMVITGVADKLPSRIKKLVYVDAFFPYNQESVFSITKRKPNKKDLEKGFIYPFWVSDDKKPPKDVPHPLKTFTDKLILKNPDRNKIPTHYILTYEKDSNPLKDDFALHFDRAKKQGIKTYLLESDHNPQWSAPEKFSKLIIDLK